MSLKLAMTFGPNHRVSDCSKRPEKKTANCRSARSEPTGAHGRLGVWLCVGGDPTTKTGDSFGGWDGVNMDTHITHIYIYNIHI